MTAASPPEDERHVAVLDIGKTNVKLNVATRQGRILETRSTPNATRDGPPYRHHDLEGLEAWLLEGLEVFARTYPLGAFVTCGHGSGGILVDDGGPVMPMIDYEQPVPPKIGAAYAAQAGSYRDRGSPIMTGATHLARQLLWIEEEHGQAFRRARWILGLPQYWAWRLSGVAASEVTILGAQSNLWNVADRRVTALAKARGWDRLLPPFAPAWKALGPVRPDLAHRHGLPGDMTVLCGVHDSAANFYRYQAAGLKDMTVVSTGTWIVGLSSACGLSVLSEARGMTCNAEVHGTPLAGALTMGGREFSLVAGIGATGSEAGGGADPRVVARLVKDGVMALPSFGEEDGLFPGSAGRGTIAGPFPEAPEARRALAVLYTALLTDVCLDALHSEGLVVLDGSFVRDPLYASLVAALRPGARIVFNLDAYGTAAGSALLADHETRGRPVPIDLQTAPRLDLPELAAYRLEWLKRARAGIPSATPGTEING
jgi:sugar (pentulose or hexulose) kinase